MPKSKAKEATGLWPASSIATWPIEQLVPYARNSKKHSDTQVEQIAGSITEFGFTVPILAAEDGTIIAGHGRVLAAKMLGLVELPVMVARGWTEAQRRAYTIADNKLAENGEWDEELLSLELGELRDEGYDIGLVGFDTKALERLLDFAGNGGNGDPETTPTPPVNPVSRSGDVWVLGHHRIICGDSTRAETVATLLAGEKPHLMVTDPPYGVEYDPEWRERAGVNTATAAKGKVLNDDKADWREAWELFPGDVAYVWHAGLYAGIVAESLTATGFVLRSQIVWDKGQLVLSRGDYHWQHEPCWYAVRKGATGRWSGDRKQTTVWEYSEVAEVGDGPRHAKAGRMHAPPDREQFGARRCCL